MLEIKYSNYYELRNNIKIKIWKIPKQANGSYYFRGNSRDKIKKPKSVKVVSADHLISRVEDLLVRDYLLEDFLNQEKTKKLKLDI